MTHTTDTHTLDATLAAVGLTDDRDAWARGWARSQQTYCEGAGDLLNVDRLSETCHWLAMSATVRDKLLHAAAAIREDPAICRLAWHLDWTLSEANDAAFHRRQWPMLPEQFGEVGRLFHGVVYLAAVRHARQRHAALNVPESISRDTLQDLELHIQHYHERHDCWGFNETYWISSHLRGLIYRLGRLQFEIHHFEPDFHGLRQQTAPAATRFLAGDGMRFRADGQFADADGQLAQSGLWQARYQADSRTIHGHPITPDGYAVTEPVALPTDQWQPVLGQGDPVLNVHIPALGPMDHTACGESLTQAMSFFPTYFPDHRFQAFTCDSWLLDPQLARYLPAASNIVRFQREFHLLPWPAAGDHQTLERVFPGKEGLPVDQLPQATSLQRIVVRHMLAGGRWRMTGGVILRDDLAWGEQVYRR
ncbi:MAG: acyltransferase domain-containing protein [Phycisphaeraceae bacterium]